MKQNKKVSILMPVFNREDLVVETLTSISNQLYKNFECIIIDDHSTDDTIKVISNYIKDDVRFYLLSRPKEKLKGASSCRNYAFSLSKGDFIQFFDSDDIMHKYHLSEKIAAINDCDFVTCNLFTFRGEFLSTYLDASVTLEYKFVNDVFTDFVTGIFPLFMQAPMWNKSYISRFMPLREDIFINEDHELYARALYEKPNFKIINAYLIFYRTGSHSLTDQFFKDASYGLESFLKSKKVVLKLDNRTVIKLYMLRAVLGLFRQSLAERDYLSAKECISFIENEKLWATRKLRFRIIFFHYFFKIIKRGDTLMKPFLKT